MVGPDTEKGLARLAEAIHQTGAKIAGQVGHAGPVANGRSNGVHALSASRMPSPLSMQMIRPASEQDLTRITAAYVDTARTLVRAGFDVLELHMAHSYLISSFLAPGLNRRKDSYGGTLENRARLARQVARAVREEVGDAVAVTAKVSVSDGFRGGVTTEESLDVAAMLEADGHLDALQLSGGSSLMNPMYLFRGETPTKEFAAAMPLPVRLGHEDADRQEVPQGVRVPRGLLPRQGAPLPRAALDAADAPGRHQPPRHHGERHGAGVRLRRHGPGPAPRARRWSTSSSPAGRPTASASTATAACRRSTPAPAAWCSTRSDRG